jgi:hypothetical protein
VRAVLASCESCERLLDNFGLGRMLKEAALESPKFKKCSEAPVLTGC